jgi:hypothetical protein
MIEPKQNLSREVYTFNTQNSAPSGELQVPTLAQTIYRSVVSHDVSSNLPKRVGNTFSTYRTAKGG